MSDDEQHDVFGVGVEEDAPANESRRPREEDASPTASRVQRQRRVSQSGDAEPKVVDVGQTNAGDADVGVEEDEVNDETRKRERDEGDMAAGEHTDRKLKNTTTYTGFGVSGAMNMAHVSDENVRSFLSNSTSDAVQQLLASGHEPQFSNVVRLLIDGKPGAKGLWAALRDEINVFPTAFSLLRHVALDVFFVATRRWYAHQSQQMQQPAAAAMLWPRQSDNANAFAYMFRNAESLTNVFRQVCKTIACPKYQGAKECARCRDANKRERLVDHNKTLLPVGRSYFRLRQQWSEDANFLNKTKDKTEVFKVQAWHEERDKEFGFIPYGTGVAPKVCFLFFCLFVCLFVFFVFFFFFFPV